MTCLMYCEMQLFIFFFFNDTATTEIYTLSLHDALPIFEDGGDGGLEVPDKFGVERHHVVVAGERAGLAERGRRVDRSEEHTSELQSRQYLVCRLLLEKKKKTKYIRISLAYNNEYTKHHM